MQNNTLKEIYGSSLSLFTDFYQMTMAYAYWKMGLHQLESVFLLSFRTIPFENGYTIAAGLENVIHYLKQFHFEKSDITYLETLVDSNNRPYFCRAFLDYLAKMTFTGHVDAMPEGSIAFPHEPLIRIQGPLIQCQLLESPLLNLINFPTLIATKAARICTAANHEPVLEFGLRRAQGIDGALTASRSAFIGGCTATSNLMAGKVFGIPVRGTHSHSWVMAFEHELEAFKAYAAAMPMNCIFLVDTYDTLEGVKHAIEAGQWLKQQGGKMLGIRIDSGDLHALSLKCRQLLDAAGFTEATIVASNDLDDHSIHNLKNHHAEITVWGIGTNLVTAKEQPALDGVYKLAAIRKKNEPWTYKIKLSEQKLKVSNPGLIQVRRFYEKTNMHMQNHFDMLYDIEKPLNFPLYFKNMRNDQEVKVKQNLLYKDLLVPVFRKGKCVYTLPLLTQIRDYVQNEMSSFSSDVTCFSQPKIYTVGMEKTLYDCKNDLIENLKNTYHLPH